MPDVIVELERDYGYKFSFNNNELPQGNISYSAQNLDIVELLNIILDETNLSFELIDERSVILYKDAEEPSQQSRSKICGTIRDELTKASLPFANIIIEGTQYGVSADDTGFFILEYAFEKDQQIEISYIGYESKKKNVAALLNGECINFYLGYLEIDDAFLVIKDYITDGIELNDNGSSTKINPRAIGSLPGNVEPDVLEVTKFLPGVSSPSSKASDIYIRGCTPDQNLMMWEDMPVYHTAHYFGMISAFNPFITNELNIYRGGFGAEYGGRIAGVIDLKSADETYEDSFNGAGINFTHAYLYGQNRIGQKKNSSITFSGRRSYSELVRTPTFNNITQNNQQGYLLGNKEIASLPDHILVEDDFNFVDFNLKFSTRLSSKDRIQFAGLYAMNDFYDEIVDNQRQDIQQDLMKLTSYGLKFNYEHKWSDKLSSKLSLIGTSYEYDYNYKLREFNSDPRISGTKQNLIKDQQFHLTTLIQLPKDQLVETGIQTTAYDIEYRVLEESKNAKDINDDDRSDSYLHSFYALYKLPLISRLGVNAGLRVNYFENTDKVYLEPRLRVAYRINNDLSANLNYGKYNQFVSQLSVFRGNDNGFTTQLWSLAKDNKIPVQSATMYQFGILYEKNSWVADVQLFARDIKGLSSRSYDFDSLEEIDPVKGDARIRGLDILIKKRVKTWTNWLSYSFSKTEFLFNEVSEDYFPSDYDQRHTFQWSNQLKVNDWNFGLGVKFASGLPFTRMIDFETRPDQGNEITYVGIYDGVNRYRLESTHEIDLSAQYHFRPVHGYYDAYLSFSITNLLNTNNIYSRNYYLNTPKDRPIEIQEVDKSTLRFTPNLSIRVEW